MSSSPIHKAYSAKALRRLGGIAAQTKTIVELALCHGAVVVVAYHEQDGRRGRVQPNDVAVHLADAVSEEMRLRADWLETDIAIFMTEASVGHTLREDEFAPGVVLSVNGAARVLARKLYLLREPPPPNATDARDAEFLLTKISVSSPGQIKYIYGRPFPDAPMSEEAEALIQRAFHARSLAKL